MKAAYAEAFRMPEDDKLIVDCFMAILTAAFYPKLSESVWMYWIAPPASGKTLSVGPMQGHSRVMMLSTPTPNALMSGYRDEDGNDPSLIPMLDGKVLIWKDFTALMDQGSTVVNKVVGEFRDSYDQYCSKASGKGGVTEYKSRFGMIACVTDRIDSFMEMHQQLGERFLSFRLSRIQQTHQQRVRDLEPIVDSMGKKLEWLSRLQQSMHTQVDRVVLKGDKLVTPTFSAGAKQDVMIMADLLALARTSSSTTASRAELGNRIVQQFINLGHAHAMSDFRTEWNETEMDLIKRVMKDSLSLSRERLFEFMFGMGKHRPAVTLSQLVTKCGTTRDSMKGIIRQFRFSNIIQTTEGGNPDEVWYRLAPDIYESIEKTGVLR